MEEDIEHICDALYHEDCVIIDKYGNKKCRDEMKKNHAKKLEMGSKCSLLLFRVISFDTIEIKYSLQNDHDEEKIINQLLTTNDNNQIVKAQVMIEKSLSKDEIVCQKLLKRTFPKKRQSKKEADEDEDDKEQEQEKQSKRRKMGVEPKLNMTAPTAA